MWFVLNPSIPFASVRLPKRQVYKLCVVSFLLLLYCCFSTAAGVPLLSVLKTASILDRTDKISLVFIQGQRSASYLVS